MSRRHALIRQYCHMWETRDFSALDALLSPDCRYEECYGPIYRDRAEIHAWISAKLQEQVVQAWTLHDWLDTEEDVIVTWTFAATEGAPLLFDGVSLIHFNAADQIDHVREFSATHQRTTPYA